MGRMFRLRAGAGYVIMSKGRPLLGETMMDENDPDFKGQAYKFDPIEVKPEDADANRAKKTAQVLSADLVGVEAMKRPDLVKLYARIAGEEPPDGINVPDLKAVLILIRDGGVSPAEALEEICGKTDSASKSGI